MKYKFQNDDVKYVFGGFKSSAREKLLTIRDMIFQQADKNKKIGPIEESLKWGQPSYVPISKCGSPIRLGIEKNTSDKIGLYVHCGTNLIETFKHIYPDEFNYRGNRGVLFDHSDGLPLEPLRHIISIALTYHLK